MRRLFGIKRIVVGQIFDSLGGCARVERSRGLHLGSTAARRIRWSPVSATEVLTMIRMKPVLLCSLFATVVVLFAATFAEAGWRHHRQAEPGCAAVEPGCSAFEPACVIEPSCGFEPGCGAETVCPTNPCIKYRHKHAPQACLRKGLLRAADVRDGPEPHEPGDLPDRGRAGLPTLVLPGLPVRDVAVHAAWLWPGAV